MSKTTLKDIADHVGVSITTVSRVLNGQAVTYRIKKETETAVIKAARELGFTPFKSIYKPFTSSTKTIGLIIPDLSHHFLSNLAKTIRMEAFKKGYFVSICESREDTEAEKEAIEFMLSQNVDGIVVLPVGIQGQHLQEVYSQGIPIVVVDRLLPDINCPSVGIDNYNGALEATNFLFENGHKDIACLQRLPQAFINNERLKGFKDSYKNHGIELDESHIIGDKFGQKNGYLEAKLLFSGSNRPTAIFAMSHLMAMGTFQVMREEGIKMPEDVSLISFDDLPFSEYFPTPISTVKQPVTEMGLMAINLLIEQMDSPKAKEAVTIKLPTTFINRASVKRLN